LQKCSQKLIKLKPRRNTYQQCERISTASNYKRKPLDNPILQNSKKRSWLQLAIIIVCAAGLASVTTVWLAWIYLFPKAFKPVQLNTREEKVLNTKIDALTSPAPQARNSHTEKGRPFQVLPAQGESPAPERYDEKNASREIQLTERELNGLLARNTDLAKKLAIDLSDDLASAKLLIPLDPDFPFLGGKTLKVSAGLELRYTNQKPVVIVRGVSIWGVPIPNAWLGGIKNIDLVREFGTQGGFWRTFAEGVEDIRIVEGRLSIKLKE